MWLTHNDQGGGTVLLKVTQGARFPLHDHPGGEEVYVIYGRAVGGVTVNTGDYLWTPPHGTHDLQAEEETLLFVSAPKGIRLISSVCESRRCREPWCNTFSGILMAH